jgi:hypothetical protein
LRFRLAPILGLVPLQAFFHGEYMYDRAIPFTNGEPFNFYVSYENEFIDKGSDAPITESFEGTIGYTVPIESSVLEPASPFLLGAGLIGILSACRLHESAAYRSLSQFRQPGEVCICPARLVGSGGDPAREIRSRKPCTGTAEVL